MDGEDSRRLTAVAMASTLSISLLGVARMQADESSISSVIRMAQRSTDELSSNPNDSRRTILNVEELEDELPEFLINEPPLEG